LRAAIWRQSRSVNNLAGWLAGWLAVAAAWVVAGIEAGIVAGKLAGKLAGMVAGMVAGDCPFALWPAKPSPAALTDMGS